MHSHPNTCSHGLRAPAYISLLFLLQVVRTTRVCLADPTRNHQEWMDATRSAPTQGLWIPGEGLLKQIPQPRESWGGGRVFKSHRFDTSQRLSEFRATYGQYMVICYQTNVKMPAFLRSCPRFWWWKANNIPEKATFVSLYRTIAAVSYSRFVRRVVGTYDLQTLDVVFAYVLITL